jgi:hypothetical protein
MLTSLAAGALVGAAALAAALPAASRPVAQEPLPTPRGQLGGREDLDQDQPGIAVTVPPLRPTPSLPPTIPPVAVAVATPTAAAAPRRDSVVGSVVSVVAEHEDGLRIGSGWAWDNTGIIVTATALVDDADRVMVVVPGEDLGPASVEAVDKAAGVAVLGVDAEASDSLAGPDWMPGNGESVFVMGRAPDGFDVTATVGHIDIGGQTACRIALTLDEPMPYWLLGAPVVGRGGLVGMAVSAEPGLPTAEPGAAASPVAAADGPPSGGTACVVPLSEIAEVVHASGFSEDANVGGEQPGTPTFTPAAD